MRKGQIKHITQLIINDLKTNQYTTSELAHKYNKCPTKISRIKRFYNINYKVNKKPGIEIDWKVIQQYYDKGNSLKKCRIFCRQKFNRYIHYEKVKRYNLLKFRTYSESKKFIKFHKHSEITKQKLRKIMINRHKQGLAWTFAHNKRKPSYPEKWFVKVIHNEFMDKNYKSEFRFGRYSLDFAWPEKKKVIEIDGEQHYTQQSQIKSDIIRDKFIKSQGWQLLRIRWKEISNNTKSLIQKANCFIGK